MLLHHGPYLLSQRLDLYVAYFWGEIWWNEQSKKCRIATQMKVYDVIGSQYICVL